VPARIEEIRAAVASTTTAIARARVLATPSARALRDAAVLFYQASELVVAPDAKGALAGAAGQCLACVADACTQYNTASVREAAATWFLSAYHAVARHAAGDAEVWLSAASTQERALDPKSDRLAAQLILARAHHALHAKGDAALARSLLATLAGQANGTALSATLRQQVGAFAFNAAIEAQEAGEWCASVAWLRQSIDQFGALAALTAEAEPDLDQADVSRRLARSLRALALAQLRTGEAGEAVAAVRRSLDALPTAPGHALLAVALHRTGDPHDSVLKHAALALHDVDATEDLVHQLTTEIEVGDDAALALALDRVVRGFAEEGGDGGDEGVQERIVLRRIRALRSAAPAAAAWLATKLVTDGVRPAATAPPPDMDVDEDGGGEEEEEGDLAPVTHSLSTEAVDALVAIARTGGGRPFVRLAVRIATPAARAPLLRELVRQYLADGALSRAATALGAARDSLALATTLGDGEDGASLQQQAQLNAALAFRLALARGDDAAAADALAEVAACPGGDRTLAVLEACAATARRDGRPHLAFRALLRRLVDGGEDHDDGARRAALGRSLVRLAEEEEKVEEEEEEEEEVAEEEGGSRAVRRELRVRSALLAATTGGEGAEEAAAFLGRFPPAERAWYASRAWNCAIILGRVGARHAAYDLFVLVHRATTGAAGADAANTHRFAALFRASCALEAAGAHDTAVALSPPPTLAPRECAANLRAVLAAVVAWRADELAAPADAAEAHVTLFLEFAARCKLAGLERDAGEHVAALDALLRSAEHRVDLPLKLFDMFAQVAAATGRSGEEVWLLRLLLTRAGATTPDDDSVLGHFELVFAARRRLATRLAEQDRNAALAVFRDAAAARDVLPASTVPEAELRWFAAVAWNHGVYYARARRFHDAEQWMSVAMSLFGGGGGGGEGRESAALEAQYAQVLRAAAA
jgi:hypothetical protein